MKIPTNQKKILNITKTGMYVSVFPFQTHGQNTASYFPPPSYLKFSKKKLIKRQKER